MAARAPEGGLEDALPAARFAMPLDVEAGRLPGLRQQEAWTSPA